jgi:hypothetical protein
MPIAPTVRPISRRSRRFKEQRRAVDAQVVHLPHHRTQPINKTATSALLPGINDNVRHHLTASR